MERDLEWKTLSSEYLIKDTWATVRKDTCETSDGNIISPYYVYEFPDWVCALAITKDGNVILERQYRHALGESGYEVPGGCVDATDKSYDDAIARELLEETGYQFEKYIFLGNTSANPSTNNNLMHLYLATGGEKVAEQKLDDGEELEIVFATIDQVKQMLRNNQFIQSMHVACIMLALEKLGELKY